MLEDLINEVKIRPAIYDKSDPNYKDRKSAFIEVAKVLNSRFNTRFDVENIKRMWENIEKDFRKIYELIKFAPSGCDAKATAIASFSHSENCSFLINSAQHRPSIRSIETKASTSQQSSIWTLPKKTTNRKRKAPAIPAIDKFALAPIGEEMQVKDMVGQLKNMIQQKSNSIIESINQSTEPQAVENPHFSFITQKFKSIPAKDIDNCFLNILEELNNLKEQ